LPPHDGDPTERLISIAMVDPLVFNPVAVAKAKNRFLTVRTSRQARPNNLAGWALGAT
jgi:hypothetical protein